MSRREFLGGAVAVGVPCILAARTAEPETESFRSPGAFIIPDKPSGMSLKQLRDDLHERFFGRYLPFWDNGGFDRRRGGFVCELHGDGSVANNVKETWYQGRAVWVYSFLYNNFGKDKRWLDVAENTKRFMLEHLYAGDGRWHHKVDLHGNVLEDVQENVYDSHFAAEGLAEYYKASGDEQALRICKQSLRAAVSAYDAPDYYGAPYYFKVLDCSRKGLRAQADSMLIVRTLSQLLAVHDDADLQELQKEHVNLIMNKFWNGEYGIQNEFLSHDYSRIPGLAPYMFVGHAVETMWMVMFEALRTKNLALFHRCKRRVYRFLEICWDYVFEGCATTDFFAEKTPKYCPGPDYQEKTTWAHCEILVVCMTIYEHTGEARAKAWYDRTLAYVLKNMANTGHGVWRQAVDRRGHNLKRANFSNHRMDNYHQPRMLMLNLLSLDRMISNQGKPMPFPR